MEAHTGLGTNTRSSGLPVQAALMRDERLAWQVGKGSERAFAALYHRYHQALYRYCRSLLRDDADAQDALQSTFAAAFAALRHGRRDAPLRPWLFRIAHNESISILRRRRAHSELPDAVPARAAGIEEQAEHHERLRRLVADMRELPERQRAALLMRELSGLSHEEIALALQSSVGTAKQTIYEARRALAEFEEGRMASCDEICRTISNGDRRALRGRKVRAHLRDCAACSAFAAAIPARSADLRALAPGLPPAATALLLSHLLAGSVSRGGGSTGAVGAGAASKATVALGGAKVATTVAVAVTATIGVASALRPHDAALPAHSRSSSAISAGALRNAGAALNPGLARAHLLPGDAGAAAVLGGAAARREGLPPAAASHKSSTAGSPLIRHTGKRRISSTAAGSTSPPPGAIPSTSPGSGSSPAQSGGQGAAVGAGGQPPPQASHGQGGTRGHGGPGGPGTGGSGDTGAGGSPGHSGEAGGFRGSGGTRGSGAGGNRGSGAGGNRGSGAGGASGASGSGPGGTVGSATGSLNAHGANPIAATHRATPLPPPDGVAGPRASSAGSAATAPSK